MTLTLLPHTEGEVKRVHFANNAQQKKEKDNFSCFFNEAKLQCKQLVGGMRKHILKRQATYKHSNYKLFILVTPEKYLESSQRVLELECNSK